MNAPASSLTRVQWRIPNMDCAAEEGEIRRALAPVPGVRRLRFQLAARLLMLEADPQALPQAEAALRAAGFAPQAVVDGTASAMPGAAPAVTPGAACCHGSCAQTGGAPHAAPPRTGQARAVAGWSALWQAPGRMRMAAALALALGAELWHALAPGGWAAGGMALALAAVLLAGLSTYAKGLGALRRGRLSINALMAVAVTGAFAIGQWPEAAMVMALYALAEHLEAHAVDRARGAIARLLDMAPAEVERQDAHGHWQRVPVAQVQPGQVIRVKPGARLALDGTVLEGRSAVNQAPVTGESLPVDKSAGDAVYAGTLNETGVLQVRVSAAAADTQLARIIQAVEQAQSERAPMQAFIDRFAALYTPAVFALALAVALLGPLLAGWAWPQAIYKALVLLVIACPCALVIATPVTVVSALARAAQLGLLVKGGIYLEGARRLRTVAFDKTGTLTTGQPVLAAAEALADDEDPMAVYRWAHALAAHSQHPVASAIATGLAAGPLAPPMGGQAVAAPLPVHDLLDQPGLGVQATVAGQRLRLVSERAPGLALTPAQAARLAAHQAAGRSVSLLARGPQALALLAVADRLQPGAPAAVAALHSLGLQTVILSGDHPLAVQAVAHGAGVRQAHGHLMPDDKLARIRALQAAGPVAMVGDGINDAPALAAADIGLAVGGAGADVALEAADVVLMNGDLARIATLVRLSRHTHRVLWGNVAVALGIKAGFLALALAGHATMWMAVFADVGASLLVVGAGLRLLRWREKT